MGSYWSSASSSSSSPSSSSSTDINEASSSSIESQAPPTTTTTTTLPEESFQISGFTGSRRRRYGWIPDKTNETPDTLYKLNYTSENIPPTVDLREKYTLPPVYDQGELGSCTANAIAFAYQFEELKQSTSTSTSTSTQMTPSRLFIYYNERDMEGTTETDSGAQIRDGMKSVHKQGVCSEDLWPYDTSKYTEKPPEKCYLQASEHQALTYNRVLQTENLIQTALANDLPVVFGFIVFTSFESIEVAKTGFVSIPTENDKPLGGHAVAIVGYDIETQYFICRNSWGDDWGDEGYFYMPYEYVLNPVWCNDFWVIRKVE